MYTDASGLIHLDDRDDSVFDYGKSDFTSLHQVTERDTVKVTNMYFHVWNIQILVTQTNSSIRSHSSLGKCWTYSVYLNVDLGAL